MNWPIVPLKEMGSWFGGGTPSKRRSEFWENGTIPWLSPKDMREDVLRGTQDHITEAAIAESPVRRVPANSVALVVRSGILERKVPVTLVPFVTTLNQDMKAVFPRPDIDPRWIAWGLRAFEREILATTRKAGTTVASIEVSRLLAFGIPVPPLLEQQQIVEVLEDHYSRLEKAESLLIRSSTQIHMLRAAQLLSLTLPEQAIDQLLRDPRELGGDEEPPTKLPAGWSWKRWKEVGACQNGKPFPSKDYQDEGIRLLRPGNLGSDGKVHWGRKSTRCLPEQYLEAHSGSLLKPGDIVMNLTAQSLKDDFLGRVCLIGEGDAALLNQRIARLSSHTLLPEYALEVFRSRLFRHYVKSLSTGSLIQHMFTKQVDRFWMPVPDRESQSRIVAKMSDFDSVLEKLSITLEIQSRKNGALRRSLLDAAFSGRLSKSVSDVTGATEPPAAEIDSLEGTLF
ncbi:restriction endonuclease subunit S [Streptomyces sp. NPDC002580]|uniref:restriction endonuclease subunit S n=1 Tax=Streptomyces sp. NPDC002580 TaxID=3364653 RepID=UPI0036BBD49D